MTDLDNFREFLIDELRFSPQTVSASMKKLHYIFTYSEGTSREAIQEFIRHVWSTKGNQTANEYIKVANRWLVYQHEKPLKYFKTYGNSFTIKICTPEEKELLLATATRMGKREKAMIYLLFGTGVRLGEAVNLKIPDIHNDTIKVLGKGQKAREVFLPWETADAIKDYLEVRAQPSNKGDEPYLWTTAAGRRMTYNYFRRICQDISRISGVKWHPHMARHTYATDLLRAGVSVVYVSQLLGHEDLQTTSIYLHPSQYDAISHVRDIDLFRVHNPKDLKSTDPPGFEPGSSASKASRIS